MSESRSFNEVIEEHLAQIAALCRDVGSPQWANHISLILGDPHTLHGTVLWGTQDLDALQRLIDPTLTATSTFEPVNQNRPY
jgi:hypothetical protein